MDGETRSGRSVPAYSEWIDIALRMAAAAHHADVRKGTSIPYVMHPFHVGLILDRHGFAEDVVIAGILHDMLEDPDYARGAVQGRLREVCPALGSAPLDGNGFRDAVVTHVRHTFGGGVFDLVTHVTEQKVDESGVKRPWRTRKEEQLSVLAEAPAEVCALKAADCLHNLHALTRDLHARGRAAMDRFNAPPDEILWYHERVAGQVTVTLGAEGAFSRELAGALAAFKEALRLVVA